MSHPCCCWLRDATDWLDRCPNRVESNDQPFCDECEAAGHHKLPGYEARLPEPGQARR